MGLKYDEGKIKIDLLIVGLSSVLLGVGKVLTFGAIKYEENSWQTVDDGQKRYTRAMYRHLLAWHSGETHDPESGLHHVLHALCNLMFVAWFVINTKQYDIEEVQTTSDVVQLSKDLKDFLPSNNKDPVDTYTRQVLREKDIDDLRGFVPEHFVGRP